MDFNAKVEGPLKVNSEEMWHDVGYAITFRVEPFFNRFPGQIKSIRVTFKFLWAIDGPPWQLIGGKNGIRKKNFISPDKFWIKVPNCHLSRLICHATPPSTRREIKSLSFVIPWSREKQWKEMTRDYPDWLLLPLSCQGWQQDPHK